MAITRILAHLLSDELRELGESLADSIYIASTSRPDHITAFVRGEPALRIDLTKTSRRIETECRCSRHRSTRLPCEHIWALLVYLDRSEPEIVDHLEDAAKQIAQLASPAAPVPKGPAAASVTPAPDALDLQSIAQRLSVLRPTPIEARGLRDVELVYHFAHPWVSMLADGLELTLAVRKTQKSGKSGAVRITPLSRGEIAVLAPGAESELVEGLLGRATSWSSAGRLWYREHSEVRMFQLRNPHDRSIVKALCDTGRAVLKRADGIVAVTWNDLGFDLRLVLVRENEVAHLAAAIYRGGKAVFEEGVIPCSAGVALQEREFHPFDDHGCGPQMEELFSKGSIVVPGHRAAELVGKILELSITIPLEVPEDLRYREIEAVPVPELAFEGLEGTKVRASVGFWYDEHRLDADSAAACVVDPERRVRIRRMDALEAAALARLSELGLKADRDASWSLPRQKLSGVSRRLLAAGWRVLADKRSLVEPGEVHVAVSSGIDWFDLDGQIKFGGASVSIVRLLAKKARESGFVELGDGKLGLLPEEWLTRHEALVALAEVDEESQRLRFTKSRAVLLDALLAERAEVQADPGFAHLRRRIHAGVNLAPKEPPASFRGELRPYQKEALGWFEFLRGLGLCGCLADDMGLGKTVQVLAMLEERRLGKGNGEPRTSLVVAPRSLVFHWQREANRFAPELLVLDFARSDRLRDLRAVSDHDLVITTYGTLRRDVEVLSEFEFDYAILDEAQAIKNQDSQVAKAARLLRARHRLALSGTPVENHIGELVSLFEFLNPGLLAGAPAIARALRGATADSDAREALGRALRPFLLRRKKQQVAKELPERVEETLWCELGETQRRFYEDVKETVRERVLGVAEVEITKVLATVLTGLLRMRQAACHPGLIDPKRAEAESAKLDVLLDRLLELSAEGHKALVFSQFTSLLELVRSRLTACGIRYEYLDGQTLDRQAPVERFQADDSIGVFLISLKAGGVGLNLTAASYVFLLDPWWNPAVEAQAIDRAHRIGQTQRVIAYRLIAKDTVEERILELQKRKRALADAILGTESGPLTGMTRQDLELLLS